MNELTIPTEIIEYTCGNCRESLWHLRLGYTPDGHTKLIISCANLACIDERREVLGADEDTLIIWDEFDITGQGRDDVSDALIPEHCEVN